MHVWAIEVKQIEGSKYEPVDYLYHSRFEARLGLKNYTNYYKTRVVKYISTKGE